MAILLRIYNIIKAALNVPDIPLYIQRNSPLRSEYHRLFVIECRVPRSLQHCRSRKTYLRHCSQYYLVRPTNNFHPSSRVAIFFPQVNDRIVMTFAGLYLYDRAKMEVARGERKVQRIEFKEKHLLPLDTSDLKRSTLSTPADPFSMSPLSATSATEKYFREPPRRRSTSVTERPIMLHVNWNMGDIMQLTPPITPRRTSPVLQPPPRSENKGVVMPKSRQQKRRYSGSFHVLEQVNEFQNAVKSPRTQYPPEGMQEKASWE